MSICVVCNEPPGSDRCLQPLPSIDGKNDEMLICNECLEKIGDVVWCGKHGRAHETISFADETFNCCTLCFFEEHKGRLGIRT